MPKKMHLIRRENVQAASHDLAAFLEACARGDPQARTAFQEAYGALVYTFPTRIYQVSQDDAGDFYLYAFDNDRIFKRARTFAGRNAIQFETYLSYYVLRDLFLEWQRSLERVEIVSLDAPITAAEAGRERARTLHEVLATEDPAPAAGLEASEAEQDIERMLGQLDTEKRLVLKLLALGTVELALDDIRALAQLASRSIRETLVCLAEVNATLAAQAQHVQEKWDTLHTVGHWIQTYQRQIAALETQLHTSRERNDATALAKLTHARTELERKLVWRYEQQARLCEELRRADVRPAYKDMARLLNVPVGTICSKIARAREALAQILDATRAEHT